MLDHLRQVIGLRGYGQRDPLQEYKSEAFNLYESDDRASARSGDGAADAGRDRAAGGPAAELPQMEAHKFNPNTGEDEMAFAQCVAGAGGGRTTAIRTIRRPGARSAATRIVPAAQARSTSTATARYA